MPPAWRPPNQFPTNRPAQPPAYLANRFPVALNSPLCTLLAYTVKMIPIHMRLMHNSHSRHAFRETTTSRFESPDYICRDCGGEKHHCGRVSAALEPACGEPRLAASPSDVRSEEHTSELLSQSNLVCRLLLEKKKKNQNTRRGVYLKKKVATDDTRSN